MTRVLQICVLSASLSLSACIITDHPDVPTTETVTATTIADKAAQAAPVVTPPPAPEPPPAQPVVPEVPLELPPPGPPKGKGKGKRATAATPDMLITYAHKTAHVEPSARGYVAGNAIHRFLWHPGKLYVVYVNHQQPTKLILPPGERLATKIWLDPEDWSVGQATVGTELTLHDEVFIVPASETTKSLYVSLLTENGHSFDIQLAVSKVAMFAVTWIMPQMPGAPQ